MTTTATSPSTLPTIPDARDPEYLRVLNSARGIAHTALLKAREDLGAPIGPRDNAALTTWARQNAYTASYYLWLTAHTAYQQAEAEQRRSRR